MMNNKIIFNEMANSADPDQTAPRSSLIWVCTVCSDILSEYFDILWYP